MNKKTGGGKRGGIVGEMGDGQLLDEQSQLLEMRTAIRALQNDVQNLQLVRESQNKRLQKQRQTIASLEKKVQSLKRPKEGRLITAAQRKQLAERFYENFWALADRTGIELWVEPWDED